MLEGAIDSVTNWGRETVAGLAKDHPEAAEWLARWKLGDDLVDMVKFLHKEDPNLPEKIEEARKNPIFKAIYDGTPEKPGVYARAKEQIQAQIDNMPAEWQDAATRAGIPVAELAERMKKNGAEKLAYTIASSVQDEIHNAEYYSGTVVRDVLGETKDKTWKEPAQGFWENPIGWIVTMFQNVVNMVTSLFSGVNRKSLEDRGMKYAVEDAEARADSIVANVGKKLVAEMGMPASFAAETMLTTYENIKITKDPTFSLSDGEKSALKAKYLSSMNTIATEYASKQATTKPTAQTAASAAASTPTASAQAAPPQEQKGAWQATKEYFTSSGDSKPEYNYPEFKPIELAKHMKNNSLTDNVVTNSTALTVGLILASSEEQQMAVIQSCVPGAKFSRDSKGNLIVGVGKDKYYMNLPGASSQDVMQPAMTVMKWAPVGRIASIAAAGKGMIVSVLATLGVNIGWSAGADSIVSVISGKPDIDVGNALLEGGIASAAFPALRAIPVGKLGALAKKLVSNKPLEEAESKALAVAGVDPAGLKDNIIQFFKNHKLPVIATGATLPIAAAAGNAPKGEAIEYSNVPNDSNFKPLVTPSRTSTGQVISHSAP